MRFLDRVLQRRRLHQAMRFLPGRVRLVDVGAFHGELFDALGDRLIEGFGVEPVLEQRLKRGRFTIEPGFFPSTRPGSAGWDAITMLAMFEHTPVSQYADMVDACHDLLRADGRLILTVPSPRVDRILALLKFVRLIDGMSLEEHHGYRPEDTPVIFAPPRFRLHAHERFQFGLNHLFVFEKSAAG